MTKTPASLRSDPGRIHRTGGRFASESVAEFSGIRSIKAYADREASFRLRMYVLFGPVIFGGLTGLGGVSLAAGTYGIMPDRFWWVALIFLVGSIAPATVACIFLILLGLESGQPPVPPPRRAAA